MDKIKNFKIATRPGPVFDIVKEEGEE